MEYKELNKGILLQAWFPLGHGDKTLIEQPIFEELSKKYNKSKVQIILRWHIQMNNIVIPGASKEEHIKQNINIFDFELTDEDLEKIQKLDTGTRFFTMSEEEQERAFTGFAPDFNNQK